MGKRKAKHIQPSKYESKHASNANNMFTIKHGIEHKENTKIYFLLGEDISRQSNFFLTKAVNGK